MTRPSFQRPFFIIIINSHSYFASLSNDLPFCIFLSSLFFLSSLSSSCHGLPFYIPSSSLSSLIHILHLYQATSSSQSSFHLPSLLHCQGSPLYVPSSLSLSLKRLPLLSLPSFSLYFPSSRCGLPFYIPSPSSSSLIYIFFPLRILNNLSLSISPSPPYLH